MDIFDEELLRFWRVLNEHQVRYIMVGGVATNLHGYQRLTEDIDLWLDDTLENRKKLRSALADYGMGDFDAIERMQFVPGWTTFQLNNGAPLDIMTSIKGMEEHSFEECLEYASIAEIYGVKIPFLHINHLITAKKASDRPKDRIDVANLEKIKEMEDNNPQT
ncbi:nucleotidyltransferase [Chitinophaga vietnamensis]|uniref:nucleotidyltransferase n=1 Tax=Chitinophaga vietnamensis TaxID=2593957 RepID=UPI001178BF71|nr:nucleotidyltransferase [Chitinophaga vietnamensis]